MSLQHQFTVSVALTHHGVGPRHLFSPQTQSLTALAAVLPTQVPLDFDLHDFDLSAKPALKKIVDEAKNGPCIVFAVLGDGTNPTPRGAANVTACTGIGLDLDEGTLDEAGIRGILDTLGIAYWVYSSFRHHSAPDPQKPWQKRKWRVVIPFSRPATKEEHASAFASFQALFTPHKLDTACTDPSRLFYLPRIPAGSPHYQSWIQDGKLFEPPAARSKARGRPPETKDIDPDVMSALDALRFPEPDDASARHKLWVDIGHAIKREFGDDAYPHWVSWSSQYEFYDEARCKSAWAGFDVSRKGVGVGTIFHLAKEAGWVSSRDKLVEELNEKLFVGSWGKQTAVFAVRDDGPVPLPESALDLQYANRHVPVGKNKSMNAFKYWRQHSARRSYSRVVFDPAPNRRVDPDTYNLWTGFAVEPRAGSWVKMRDHIFDVICAGDPNSYQHLMCWLADLVQNPAQPAGHAIVLRSTAQGTGKGLLMEYLGRIFGRHYMTFNKPDQVVGRFNGHMARVILGFADEAFFAGSYETKNALKAMITEQSLSVEYKGVDIEKMPNYVHWVFASNEDWVVRIEPQDRRFFCLEVSDSRVGDTAYFDAIGNEMNNGGPEALLYYLLHRVDPKAVKYNRYHPPTSRLHLKQKLHSMEPMHAWWYGILVRGQLPFFSGGSSGVTLKNAPPSGWQTGGPANASVGDLLSSAREVWSKANAARDVTDQRLLATLDGLVPGHQVVGDIVHLPPLANCRAAFEGYFRALGMIDWANSGAIKPAAPMPTKQGFPPLQ